ncbi:hypothetical protein AXG93_392s1030 [Marchantia polymorpha subsp. ruderalis]|uniref:Uncharacterized protein n=1 Tax=Marchantia polymorpha subsp. ruderalis TaxID=1480154 RepID=A0A176WQ70_MARPO|nr:hypothetical protein AXG93_392s1030 [Marchantia polymorpha subsp. ruderalis]
MTQTLSQQRCFMPTCAAGRRSSRQLRSTMQKLSECWLLAAARCGAVGVGVGVGTGRPIAKPPAPAAAPAAPAAAGERPGRKYRRLEDTERYDQCGVLTIRIFRRESATLQIPTKRLAGRGLIIRSLRLRLAPLTAIQFTLPSPLDDPSEKPSMHRAGLALRGAQRA